MEKCAEGVKEANADIVAEDNAKEYENKRSTNKFPICAPLSFGWALIII
jgi:hypothetical protein